MLRDRTTRGVGGPFAGGLLLICLIGALLAPPARAAAPSEFFGVSAVRPTEVDFRLMPQYGVGAYRLGLGWRGIQPNRREKYSWGGADQQVRWASESGLQVYPYLVGTPKFVQKRGTKSIPPVRRKLHREKWEAFVAATVARYGPGGDFWRENPDLVPRPARDYVIWNEQNAQTFWKPAANPREYARLVRLSRSGIDSVDPDVRLVTGGIYGYPQNSKSMFAVPFLRKLYQKRGMVKAIDGISIHPYAPKLAGVKKQVRDMRRVALRAGDRKVDLWIGEVGWASGGRKHELTKNPAKQAKLLESSYRFFLAKRKAWRIRSVMWFVWRDYTGDEICSWCPEAGLLDADHTAKPSGKAYRGLASKSR